MQPGAVCLLDQKAHLDRPILPGTIFFLEHRGKDRVAAVTVVWQPGGCRKMLNRRHGTRGIMRIVLEEF